MNDCIFCKIASGAMKSKIVYQDDDVVAFEDISPQAPVHLLFIPKEHVDRIADMDEAKGNFIFSKIFRAISKVVASGKMPEGYRVVVNQGAHAGQAVPHLHFHLLAGRGFSWPPG